jgi:predicted metal-dependent phosphoesterase TrpH
MKIDIHVHTRKVKSGDAPTRNIEKERFVEILSETEVNILAITNHNHFDSIQYEEFRDGVENHCQMYNPVKLGSSSLLVKFHILFLIRKIQMTKNWD